jgi:hypothetical protein
VDVCGHEGNPGGASACLGMIAAETAGLAGVTVVAAGLLAVCLTSEVCPEIVECVAGLCEAFG